jgi:hypothetical protein
MKADICRVSKTVVLRFTRSRESNRVALKPIAPVQAYLYDHEQQNLYHVHLAHQWRGIPGNASIMKGFVFTQEPVGLRMIRLQQWESGPYFAAFSLHIPDMRSFINMREIVKICPRSRWI